MELLRSLVQLLEDNNVKNDKSTFIDKLVKTVGTYVGDGEQPESRNFLTKAFRQNMIPQEFLYSGPMFRWYCFNDDSKTPPPFGTILSDEMIGSVASFSKSLDALDKFIDYQENVDFSSGEYVHEVIATQTGVGLDVTKILQYAQSSGAYGDIMFDLERAAEVEEVIGFQLPASLKMVSVHTLREDEDEDDEDFDEDFDDDDDGRA